MFITKKLNRLSLCLLVLAFGGATCFAQESDIQIKKKTSFKIPGMPALPMGGGNNLENRPSTVSIKGSRMRTDMQYKKQKMTGGKETVAQTFITQCDRQRNISFNSKKKKYFVEPIAGQTSENVKSARKGGFVTMTGSVTDTGERAKLFGYEAKHLKQSFTITPGKDACQKDVLKVEIDGWYIDVPEFSCPIRRKPREFQMDGNCFDDVDFQMKGAVSGIAVKEIKTMTIQGMSLIIEEEALEITKTNLEDAFFEPPTNYQAANTLKEVEDDSEDSSGQSENDTPIPAENSASKTPTLALPKGGIETKAVEAKKAGVVRIGIAKPSVTTPDSKKDETIKNEISAAISALLAENLESEKIEVIEFSTAAPEAEARQKECDYIFYATVTQKRSGGLFGGMIPTMPSMPGGGNSPTNTPSAATEAGRTMQGLMLQTVRAKDEFTFDFKVADLNNTVVAQAVSKTKAKQYGEDVLSPQIKDAADAVLGKMNR